MKNMLLFIVPSVIWGSTWLMIKFQLGVVDPLVSVTYRFLLAGFILLIFCKIKRLNLKYKKSDHLFFLLQGIFLFGINYWLVYLAEMDLTSGLVAIIFSIIIFLNVFNGAVFLKSPVQKQVIAGGLCGLIGILLVFRQELLSFNLSSKTSLALIIAFLSAYLASLGNIISARNQQKKLPVLQTNVYSMLYGSLVTLIIALVSGKTINFDFSFSYISSLLYLVIFGSIIAFWFYLTMIGKIGAGKAAYVGLVIPVIALGLSALFEGYVWTLYIFLGVLFILAGNFIALEKDRG